MIIGDMIVSYIRSIDTALDALYRFGEALYNAKRKERIINSPISDTVAKINTAQENLSDAIEAIETLREHAVNEKSKLELLLQEVTQKKNELDTARENLSDTELILNEKQRALKDALGINSRRDKIAGFAAGVIASILATIIWELGKFIFQRISI